MDSELERILPLHRQLEAIIFHSDQQFIYLVTFFNVQSTILILSHKNYEIFYYFILLEVCQKKIKNLIFKGRMFIAINSFLANYTFESSLFSSYAPSSLFFWQKSWHVHHFDTSNDYEKKPLFLLIKNLFLDLRNKKKKLCACLVNFTSGTGLQNDFQEILKDGIS